MEPRGSAAVSNSESAIALEDGSRVLPGKLAGRDGNDRDRG